MRSSSSLVYGPHPDQRIAVFPGAGAGAGSNNSATPPVIVNQEALPDGGRLLLQFGESGTAAGTLTRDIRLIHP